MLGTNLCIGFFVLQQDAAIITKCILFRLVHSRGCRRIRRSCLLWLHACNQLAHGREVACAGERSETMAKLTNDGSALNYLGIWGCEYRKEQIQ